MKRLWILVLAALLQACGGGGGGGTTAPSGPQSPQSCSTASQRSALLSFMQDDYYWYAQMPAPNAGAATMDAYFRSMLLPTDRFSFSETTEQYQQLFEEGTFTGYGYSLVVVDEANAVVRVRIVEPRGPAAAAGLRRGDTVLSIDGGTAAQVASGAVGGPAGGEGVPRTMQVRDTAGNVKTLQMTSATFPLTPVRDVAVLDATRNGQPVKVGYLDYTQFVTYSLDDLAAAVQGFAAQGASELVLDLRYNGGGDIATSRDLASMIAGARLAGQTFASLRYNNKNLASNQTYAFRTMPASMGSLPRVFVIVSGGTASASELVINGLKPFMDVVLVGETTYGKPYGFVPFSNCGLTYNAVNFESVNSQGVGGFTAGFAPTCAAPDDLDHPLGDPNETRLKVALGYIATGSCPQLPQSASLSKPAQRVLGEVVTPGMHTGASHE